MKTIIIGTAALGLTFANSMGDVSLHQHNRNSIRQNRLYSNQNHSARMKVEVFQEQYLRNPAKTINIRPNRCVSLPSAQSLQFDSGQPGRGWVVLCHSNDCSGKCVTERRKTWLYPQNMDADKVGGPANSMIWFLA
ncbi:hypothetical protein AX774_g3892 [Zancudomyces culisetae]|uniref:Uncharacterized protein n=1 Tax=Zancudomyces culisetae TaxID=1213189 RepID=A0A1R1PNT8_ZANCU|nr:hypothetical protein AX774_g3892 [Zancudomyces culisetae]|eukprot:OMH82624.1 hypothetical protein AX774_g3892 [Zancudomyces culisetae]